MPAFHSTPLSQLKFEHVAALEGTDEDQRLDFKREANMDKPNEWRRDLVAFANASGGDIVIGVEEVKKKGGNRAQDQPWLLATNLDKSIKRLCEIYALRMEEEESFRDLKSHCYGFALRYVLVFSVERYERMLAVWALGTWVLYAQGLAAVEAQLHYGLSTATNQHVDLSLVRIGHLLLRLTLGPPQTLFKQLAAT